MLSFVSQLTGCFTFLCYAVFIFERSGATIDPNISSIILAIMQLLGTLCTTQLVDKLGRKLLMTCSLIGCSIGLTVLSTYLYLIRHGHELEDFRLLPVICLPLVVFIGAAGFLGVVNICVVENLPSKVRDKRKFFLIGSLI